MRESVCEYKRERVKESVCARERVKVSVCEYKRERVKESVCVRERR